MRTVFIRTWLFALTVHCLQPALAQESNNTLDSYVRYGLENNLVLKQKNIKLDQSLLALREATSMFSPGVTLLGNYINGTGGRSISFPVGDLLNPVYATLNQLTASSAFPQIENVTTNFFPRDFYDVRARTSMPLLNTDLIYNKKIKGQQVLLQEDEIKIYQRELVRNIKIAYYNYRSAKESVVIYQSALSRALEGKRVNERLLENGKGLPAYILRSESEIESIKALVIETERQTENAKMYFNFLLNREPLSEIDTDFKPNVASVSTLISETPGPVQREEISQLKNYQELNQQVVKMNRLSWSPRISGFVDLGAQAENLTYNKNARYSLTGLQLEMPLFAGFGNRQKIKQSELEVRNTELGLQVVENQLMMATSISRNALISSYQNYQTAVKQLEAAQSYQRLMEKGYKEGLNSFLETIDARSQLTAAELQLRLSLYKVLIAEAGLERETASYPLND